MSPQNNPADQESVSEGDASSDRMRTTFILPAQESPLALALRPTELQLQVAGKMEGLITPQNSVEAESITTNVVCNDHINNSRGLNSMAESSPQVAEQRMSKELILQESATTWQDPICKLFKESSHRHKENSDKNAFELPEITVAPESEQREAMFRDMGFSNELIKQALQLHGAEAGDSTLLQFLLDHGETEVDRKLDEDTKLDWITRSEDELTRNFHRNVKTEDPVNNSVEAAGSSSKDEDSMNQKHMDWAAPLAELCKSKEIPTDRSGHRDALHQIGFPHTLIDQAILELGEGVEYEALFEYLLCLKSQQDSNTSTPPGRGPCINNQVATVQKLVAEYGFPKKAVERAVQRCKTPAWDVKEEEMVDVLDFLAAYREDLNMEEVDSGDEESASESDDDEESLGEGGEDSDADFWKWLHGKEEGVMASEISSGGKRDRSQIDVKSKFVKGGRPAKSHRFVPKDVKPAGVRKNPRSDSMYDGEVPGHPRGFRGFGLPGKPAKVRHLKEDLSRPPFFYFENVASMPKDEWERIQRHLFDIAPEFVDALHFSACRRPRGYIHNLPVAGRRKLLGDPPMTIQDLLPQTRAFWPPWDTRTKLNCISTHRGQSKKLHLRGGHTGLTHAQQHDILQLCRRLNLVWTAPNIPTPIDYHEIEAMLGFDRDHSRPCVSVTSRYQVLGNSFSIYTIAFHFSVLRPLYPAGIKVLSLFSGIGGAEVALHKIGIKLLVVVSVEIDEGAQRCLEAWWTLTKQLGTLNQNYHDVKDLGREELAELVYRYGGFDFIVGGSPCQNLSANNRVNRTGLDGSKSIEFFEFSRIVTAVRELTMNLKQGKATR